MAVLNKTDFFAKLQARIGEDTSDEAISFLEDVTDTFNDMETKANGGGGENWEQKYKDLDESWKKRYKERFFKGEEQPGDNKGKKPGDNLGDEDEEETDQDEPQNFDDLFNNEKEG